MRDIPEWILKYNTKEDLEKWSGKNKHKSVEELAETEEGGEFGVIVYPPDGSRPEMIACDVSFEFAVTIKNNLQSQNPDLEVSIFELFDE